MSLVCILPASIEMSNRILRQYASHVDRFLRVQFLDEIGHGRLYNADEVTVDLFRRVFRTLSQGIFIAGRLYKFLAFGNSQLREHGAFFFSDCAGTRDCGDGACHGLTARGIREAIGDVSGITIIAKQTARIGQAFSTTRAMPVTQNGITIVNIPDRVGGLRSEFNFSDGVALTSQSILDRVARDMSVIGRSPSAIQFRMGGAKGVLVLAPSSGVKLADSTIHYLRADQICLRPSQKKFQSDHDGLEIGKMAHRLSS